MVAGGAFTQSTACDSMALQVGLEDKQSREQNWETDVARRLVPFPVQDRPVSSTIPVATLSHSKPKHRS